MILLKIMPIQNDTLNRKLYNLLNSRGYNPIPKDSDLAHAGKSVPPEEADVFKFTFKQADKPIDDAWISIDGSENLTLYYDQTLANKASERTPGVEFDDSWYGLLRHLKQWAQSRQLGFNLEPKEKTDSDMAQRTYIKRKEEISENTIMEKNLKEGYYPMGKTASYNDNVPTIKIVLHHTRQIHEGEQRYRNVARIFLENEHGERILAPTNKPGLAQIYARHLAEGGLPNDDRWNHLKSLCEEYSKMAGFVRAIKSNQFNESAKPLIEAGLNHYSSLREALTKLRGQRGYNNYFESWTPALMENNDNNESINELFVQAELDPRIESVIPILSKLKVNLGEMKEVKVLAKWADTLAETTSEEDAAHKKALELDTTDDLDEDAIDDANKIVKKINIPAAQRKAQGKDWKVTKAELDKLPARTTTTSQGLKAKYDRLNSLQLSENMMDQENNPVVNAITGRIMRQRVDLLSTYGPEMVDAAIDDVASFVGDVEEIGSSDVSAWVKQVEKRLHEMDNTNDPFDADNPAPMGMSNTFKEQSLAEGAGDKVHLKTPKQGLADHPGRNTGVGLRKFSQTPEQDRCPKCNSLFKNHYKQGVSEGSDENYGVGSGAISSSISVNKNGKNIGELFQTRGGSWGYFVSANAKSQEGFGSKEEALAAMKQAMGQGVAEGSEQTEETAVINMFEKLVKQGRDPIDMIAHKFGWGSYELDQLAKNLGFKNSAEWARAARRDEGVNKGVAEGSDVPQWRVEQSDATGRYYVVSGYTNKSRRVWKSKQGAGDFSKRSDAEAKAQELNQGVAEGVAEDHQLDEASLDDLNKAYQHHVDMSNKYRKKGNRDKDQHHHTQAFNILTKIHKHPDYKLEFVDDPRVNDALAMKNDSRFAKKGVAEGLEEKDPVWNKGTPMPKDYTCHCGLYVHSSRRNPKAIHMSDCPYAKKQDKEQGVAEADKHSFVGKIQRGHELKKKVDSSWKDIGDAQKAGDKAAGSKAFRKHERYANLERPGTWTKVDEQGVAEGKDEKIAQLKQDYKTAMYWSENARSPQEREEYRRKALKIKNHLEKQYKQGVAEGFGDVVKGVKRAVKGKEHPDVVASKHLGRALGHYHQGSLPDAEKETKRYNKVQSMNKGIKTLPYPMKEEGVAEGYSLKKTNVDKYMEPGDPDEYTQDINIKDTDYEIINNKTGQVVGTASWTTNDYFGPGALKITMKNGATRWLDIWEREKGNPQTAFNRFVKDPKTAKKYKEQGVAEGKSLPSMSDSDKQFDELESQISDLEAKGVEVGKDHPLSKKWQQLVAMKQRILRRKPKKGVAEGSEWETRHDEFVTVGDRATPEQINKIVSALGVAAKQASGKRGFLNQIVGKQSNGDLARMAHSAETLAKNIQRNSKANPGTDERKELGQQLVYAVSLLKRINGEQDVAEGSTKQPRWGYHIVDQKTGNAVPNTPKFKTRQEAQQYLRTQLASRRSELEVDEFQMREGVAEGSKQRLPIVMYKEISPDMMQGRDFYQVVQSQSPFWKVGETFSDDDMSMGSRQVRFISDTGKEQGVAEGADKTIWVKPSSNHTLIVVKSSSPDIGVGEEYDEGDLYNYANKFGYNVEEGVAEGQEALDAILRIVRK